jgi:hypothetical protein
VSSATLRSVGGAVQCSAVRCTVQCSALQCSAVQCSAQCGGVDSQIRGSAIGGSAQHFRGRPVPLAVEGGGWRVEGPVEGGAQWRPSPPATAKDHTLHMDSLVMRMYYARE